MTDHGDYQGYLMDNYWTKLRKQNRNLKRAVAALMIAGSIQWLECNFADAQTPQPTAHERALEATVNELQQAWTAARTAWIAAQDENARIAADNKAKSERIAQLEAERAKAIPAPEAKP